jgi:hypothetical protein
MAKIKATRIDGNFVWVKSIALDKLEDIYLAECQVRGFTDVSVGMNILEEMRNEAYSGADEVRITYKQYRVLNP